MIDPSLQSGRALIAVLGENRQTSRSKQMNKIGKIYQVKERYWLLFSSKEVYRYMEGELCQAHPHPATGPHADLFAASMAAYFSGRYNCNVSYISPNDLVLLLELDGKFKKVLTSNGEMGWTWFTDDYNECFEEGTNV